MSDDDRPPFDASDVVFPTTDLSNTEIISIDVEGRKWFAPGAGWTDSDGNPVEGWYDEHGNPMPPAEAGETFTVRWDATGMITVANDEREDVGAAVAQRSEQATHNGPVAGSTPARRTGQLGDPVSGATRWTPKVIDVAYEFDPCPRCGSTLDAPDDNLWRRCPSCGVGVGPATITIDFT